MVFKDKRKLIQGLALAFVLAAHGLVLFAQHPPRKERNADKEDEDLVYLVKAQSLEQFTLFGEQHRKAVKSTFLHNGMTLVSDTAIWNVDNKIIHAFGHVKIVQGDTRLTSEKMDYIIEDNLAVFSGVLVQLENRKKNLLRTQHLDYNTKDSVAVFSRGASMRDEDGQIIESLDGTYDARLETFCFSGNVNMFTDSTFIMTSGLDYYSRPDRAEFTQPIDFWHGDDMLSSLSGWYDRPAETFFLTEKVHAMSPGRESWADTMFVYRAKKEMLLLGNAQMQDSVRSVTALGDRVHYSDTTSTVTLSRDAAIAIRLTENEKTDTAYIGADRIVYRTIIKDSIPDFIVRKAETRLKDISVDPVKEYREKAAREAAEARAKAEEEKKQRERGFSGAAGSDKAAPETASAPAPAAPDSLATPPADSLKAKTDSLDVQVPDSTKIGFLLAAGDVRMFRQDLQVRCDSLEYTDLDSLVRLYSSPFVWNDGNRQYTADSIYVQILNGRVEKANLMSEAFIITLEDTLLFDQIKGAEVMAYFDSTSALRRFDALGGAVALFYLEENGRIATANKVQSKMLSATLSDGQVQRVHYFETPKNDAFPLAQLPGDEKLMKGFNWTPERRPSGPADITTKTVRKSQRLEYASHPRPEFEFTRQYFPGYIEGIMEEIQLRKEGKLPPPAKPSKPVPAVAEPAPVVPSSQPDTVAAVPAPAPALPDTAVVVPVLPDSAPALPDSVAVQPDSTAVQTDSLAAPSDSLAPPPVKDTALVKAEPDPKELARQEKERKRREKEKLAKERHEAAEAAAALRIAARDARWARLDSLDAIKKAEKELKRLEKKRERTRRQLIRQMRQEEKDRIKLEKYILRYEKRKYKDENKRRKP